MISKDSFNREGNALFATCLKADLLKALLLLKADFACLEEDSHETFQDLKRSYRTFRSTYDTHFSDVFSTDRFLYKAASLLGLFSGVVVGVIIPDFLAICWSVW